MDASDIFNRGASIPRTVLLTYEDTGLPIDTDDLDDILFDVFHAVTNRELDDFSLGAGTVTIIDANNGEVRFIVPQSVSTTAKLGNYMMTVTTTETDAAFENNTQIRKDITFSFKLI